MGVPIGGRGPSRSVTTVPSVSRGRSGRAGATAGVGSCGRSGLVRRGGARGVGGGSSATAETATTGDARHGAVQRCGTRDRRGHSSLLLVGRAAGARRSGRAGSACAPRLSVRVATLQRRPRGGRPGGGPARARAGRRRAPRRPGGAPVVTCGSDVRDGARGSGAGDGNRTRVASLEDWGSTIELRPRGPWDRGPGSSAGGARTGAAPTCGRNLSKRRWRGRAAHLRQRSRADEGDPLPPVHLPWPAAAAGDGVWRRLVARPLWERKVAGSNPVTPTFARRPSGGVAGRRRRPGRVDGLVLERCP